MEGDSLTKEILTFIENIVWELIDAFAPEDVLPDEWELGKLKEVLEQRFGIDFPVPENYPELERMEVKGAKTPQEKLFKIIYERMLEEYEKMEREIGEKQMREIERMALLQNLDYYWRLHLRALDHIRESIGWRGYGQKDPVIEFKKEAFGLFEEFISNVENGTVDGIFNYFRFLKETSQKEEKESEPVSAV